MHDYVLINFQVYEEVEYQYMKVAAIHFQGSYKRS